MDCVRARAAQTTDVQGQLYYSHIRLCDSSPMPCRKAGTALCLQELVCPWWVPGPQLPWQSVSWRVPWAPGWAGPTLRISQSHQQAVRTYHSGHRTSSHSPPQQAHTCHCRPGPGARESPAGFHAATQRERWGSLLSATENRGPDVLPTFYLWVSCKHWYQAIPHDLSPAVSWWHSL